MRAIRPVLRSCLIVPPILALGACAVAPPTGPTVLVLPGHGKDFATFQHDDNTCRTFASQRIGGASPAAVGTASGLGTAAIGTGLGAAAGAAIGSFSGEMGVGAAIGAASGLLLGALFGSQNAYASAAGLQGQYNMAYVQCMTANGDQLAPGPTAVYPDYSYAPYPWYPGYPFYGWP